MGYFFDLWKEGNILETKNHWYMLSFSCKWLDSKKIHTYCLPDFPAYKKDKENDKELCRTLWRYLDQAQIVVGHNSDRFDLRRSNARFLVHNFSPCSPYQTVDTLKLARKHFSFDSNRLDALGGYLGIGRKIPNTGKHLWLKCMQGDLKAWKKMRAYNAQDVALLERLYLKLRPWSANHPNLAFMTRKFENCPVCQSEAIVGWGWRYTRTGRRHRFRCQGCGHRFDAGPLERLPK